MFSIVIAALVTGGLTYLLTRNLDKSAALQLSEARPSVPSFGVQIVCGDCAGDQEIPYRTLLNRNGRCERCSGDSYVLASTLASRALLARARRFGSRRVLPFDTPAIRSSSKTRIAV